MECSWDLKLAVWLQSTSSEDLALTPCSYKSSGSGFTSEKQAGFLQCCSSAVSKLRPVFAGELPSPAWRENLQVRGRTAAGVPFGRFSGLEDPGLTQPELSAQDWPLTVLIANSGLTDKGRASGFYWKLARRVWEKKSFKSHFPFTVIWQLIFGFLSLRRILIRRNQRVCRCTSKQCTPQPMPKPWLNWSQGCGDFCSAQIGSLGLPPPPPPTTPLFLFGVCPASLYPVTDKCWLNPTKLLTRNTWADSNPSSVRKSKCLGKDMWRVWVLVFLGDRATPVSVEMLGASVDTLTSETSTKVCTVSSGLLQLGSSP